MPAYAEATAWQLFRGCEKVGGAEGTRTLYLLVANEALYQMSYRPIFNVPGWNQETRN